MGGHRRCRRLAPAGHLIDAGWRRAVSRRRACPWLRAKRSWRIDRAEQAVSRSGGGARQSRDRGAAIRQTHQDPSRPDPGRPRLPNTAARATWTRRSFATSPAGSRG